MFTIRRIALSPTFASRSTVRRFSTRLLRLASCCLAFAGLVVVQVASGAERLPSADRQAIEQTIRSQLDAFGQEDADRAYTYASPDIQKMFGSSEAFMQMVRDRYEPVYRAGGVNFGKLESFGGQWVQTVQIVDGEGRVWRALFTMRRQPDKSWKVGGCQLVQTSALAT